MQREVGWGEDIPHAFVEDSGPVVTRSGAPLVEISEARVWS